MTQRSRFSPDHCAVARPQPFAATDMRAARRYDAWYDTPSGRRVAAAEAQLLAGLLAELAPGRSLLEVGCGTGHFAREFAGRGLTVTGLDVSPGMLAVAHERGGGPRYVEGAAERLPFHDGSFDVAAMITSLEFIDDRASALREACRIARRGLLLGVLNLASILGLRRKLVARFRPSPYRDARFATPWGLARLVRHTLGDRVRAIRWRTVLWPVVVPRLPGAQRLPFGGFIGLVAVLHDPARGGA